MEEQLEFGVRRLTPYEVCQNMKPDPFPMSATILIPPRGDVNTAPTEQDLRSLFFDSEPEYWSKGSGDAGLHRDNEGTNMIFHRISEESFCSLFQGTGEQPLVLIGQAPADKFVNVMLNGNVFNMPCSYLTNAETAFKAALSYLKDGFLNPEQHWEVFNAEMR